MMLLEKSSAGKYSEIGPQHKVNDSRRKKYVGKEMEDDSTQELGVSPFFGSKRRNCLLMIFFFHRGIELRACNHVHDLFTCKCKRGLLYNKHK